MAMIIQNKAAVFFMSEVLKFFGDKDNYFITESTDKGNGGLIFPQRAY